MAVKPQCRSHSRAPYVAADGAESKLPRVMLPDPQSQIPQLENKDGLVFLN